MTQKRCRAAGSVSADPEREEEISAPTEADNVPLVTYRKSRPVPLGDECRLFGIPEQVSNSSFPSGTKMRAKSLWMCPEYSSNRKRLFFLLSQGHNWK